MKMWGSKKGRNERKEGLGMSPLSCVVRPSCLVLKMKFPYMFVQVPEDTHPNGAGLCISFHTHLLYTA